MSVAGSQADTFLRLVRELRPRWRTDAGLPRTIQALLGSDRRFGSRDRRLYRELIYTTLRYLPWIEPWLDRDANEAVRRVAWLAADIPAAQRFRAELATGEPPQGDKTELLPAWFREHCPEVFAGAELDTQLRRPPVWLRLQGTEAQSARVFAEFDQRGWQWRRSAVLDDAVELLSEADITSTEAWKGGLIEVQDLGSQMILRSLAVVRGSRWLDACAGAGGKTLQLARLVGPTGTVEAHDVRATALAELRLRADRARLTNVRTVAQPMDAHYDGVLVDAPCSGSGTWRRFPHLKWTTTPALVAERAALQEKLLAQFAACVRPGDTLVYATCSLSRRENEDVVNRFLVAQPSFAPAPFAETFGFAARGNGLTIMPSRHDTDGFFVAVFRRK